MGNLFRKKTVSQILSESGGDGHGHGLAKTLGVRDLVAFGIAAIIGAGIFSTIGKASADGGPAVIFLFIFTAIACGFAAFAYAEFASMVPVSGSAYTYSYVAFGELFAWIIGWALIMEYSIGNITVAISWSDYFTSLLNNHFGLSMPEWITTDYFTAQKGFDIIQSRLNDGVSLSSLASSEDYAGYMEGFLAWKNSPLLGGLHVILDVPAIAIVALITWLVYVGMKESRMASNIMVAIKLIIVLMVIAVGFFYIDSANYDPFMPNGMGGVLAGISSVFFAYIGFDAISTTAEECRNPQRDLPRAILYSIVICTVLYILIALVITGLLNYKLLDVGDPLAKVFEDIAALRWLGGVIAVSAVVAMASVLLVFQMGQPRIWMAMSRDGLLPRVFSSVHPKFKTPHKATIITGLLVGVPILFIDLDLATNMCSIGTLFAFVLVCAGVIKLNLMKDAPERKFKTPYINGQFILPLLLVGSMIFSYVQYPKEVKNYFTNAPVLLSSDEFANSLNAEENKQLKQFIAEKYPAQYEEKYRNESAVLGDLDEKEFAYVVQSLGMSTDRMYKSGGTLFSERIPFYIFLLVCFYVAITALTKKYSLLPTLGLICCLYMMSELGSSNWFAFTLWLIIGLVIYFGYSRKNSKLAALSQD